MTTITQQPTCSGINSKEPCTNEGYMAKIYFSFCAKQGLTGTNKPRYSGYIHSDLDNIQPKSLRVTHQAKRTGTLQGTDALGVIHQTENFQNFQHKVYPRLDLFASLKKGHSYGKHTITSRRKAAALVTTHQGNVPRQPRTLAGRGFVWQISKGHQVVAQCDSLEIVRNQSAYRIPQGVAP